MHIGLPVFSLILPSTRLIDKSIIMQAMKFWSRPETTAGGFIQLQLWRMQVLMLPPLCSCLQT